MIIMHIKELMAEEQKLLDEEHIMVSTSYMISKLAEIIDVVQEVTE